MPGFSTPALARSAPFAAYIVFLALDSPLLQVMSAIDADARWLYPVRIVCVAALLLGFRKQYSELFRQGMGGVGKLTLALSVGVLVFVLWILPYPSWAILAANTSGFSPLDSDGNLDVVFAASRLLGGALVVPLMEELFWRSFLMRWLDKPSFLSVSPLRISLRALLITSALFAIEHNLWLAGLFAGLVYGELYRRTGTLWAPLVAHAVTNGLLGLWILETNSWAYW